MERSIVGLTAAMVHYFRRPPHSISPTLKSHKTAEVFCVQADSPRPPSQSAIRGQAANLRLDFVFERPMGAQKCERPPPSEHSRRHGLLAWRLDRSRARAAVDR